LAGKHSVVEPFSTQFFDALKELIIVFGVVMGEGQALHAGHLRKLHGLIEAAVSPSAPVLQFLSGELCIMDQQVGARGNSTSRGSICSPFLPASSRADGTFLGHLQQSTAPAATSNEACMAGSVHA
jgi:hypothetical protein